MVDVFWWFLSALIFVASMAFLLLLYKLWVGDKYTTAANKLKSQMANIRRDFPELSDNRGEFVGSSLESLGIDGILDSIGIPAIFKPIAKGFIDNIAKNPEKLKPFLDKLGIVLPDGKDTKGKESDLL